MCSRHVHLVALRDGAGRVGVGLNDNCRRGPSAGLLEAAKAGTVFLDDVGKLPAGLQDKLLRTIESGNVVRLGATRPRPIDVRFISATNQDMDRAVQDGTFHRHLFFRLNGITVEIYVIDRTRVVANPLGYPNEFRSLEAFEPAFHVEIDRAPRPRMESRWRGTGDQVADYGARKSMTLAGSEPKLRPGRCLLSSILITG